jgi:hypothetical protein
LSAGPGLSNGAGTHRNKKRDQNPAIPAFFNPPINASWHDIRKSPIACMMFG